MSINAETFWNANVLSTTKIRVIAPDPMLEISELLKPVTDGNESRSRSVGEEDEYCYTDL